MSEEAAVVSGFVDFWTHLIQNNWSLVLGLLVAFICTDSQKQAPISYWDLSSRQLPFPC